MGEMQIRIAAKQHTAYIGNMTTFYNDAQISSVLSYEGVIQALDAAYADLARGQAGWVAARIKPAGVKIVALFGAGLPSQVHKIVEQGVAP